MAKNSIRDTLSELLGETTLHGKLISYSIFLKLLSI